MTDEKRAADQAKFETFYQHLRERLEQIGRLSILTLEYYQEEVEDPSDQIELIDEENQNAEYLNANIEPWFMQMNREYDALFEAIENRDQAAIAEVLEKGLNINSAHDYNGARYTPLDFALSLIFDSDKDEDVMQIIDYLEEEGAVRHFYD